MSAKFNHYHVYKRNEWVLMYLKSTAMQQLGTGCTYDPNHVV